MKDYDSAGVRRREAEAGAVIRRAVSGVLARACMC